MIKPFSSSPELFNFGIAAAGDFCYAVEEHDRIETTINYFEARNIHSNDLFRIVQVKYCTIIPNQLRDLYGLDPIKIPIILPS